MERNRLSHRKTKAMKTNEPSNKREESTYALIVRSAERKRELIEVLVYGLVILCAVAAILEFANEFFWSPV
jgi:hypothetical protein